MWCAAVSDYHSKLNSNDQHVNNKNGETLGKFINIFMQLKRRLNKKLVEANQVYMLYTLCNLSAYPKNLFCQ
jgi:hypothetical protein